MTGPIHGSDTLASCVFRSQRAYLCFESTSQNRRTTCHNDKSNDNEDESINVSIALLSRLHHKPKLRFVTLSQQSNANVNRLVLIVVTLVIGGMSFFGFWLVDSKQRYARCDRNTQLANVSDRGSAQSYSTACSTLQLDLSTSRLWYLTDCHRDKAPEAFAAINLRNIYSFGMNYFISSWIDSQGPKEVFLYYWGNPRFHLLNGNTNVHLWEEVSQLDESCGDIPEGDESLNVVR